MQQLWSKLKTFVLRSHDYWLPHLSILHQILSATETVVELWNPPRGDDLTIKEKIIRNFYSEDKLMNPKKHNLPSLLGTKRNMSVQIESDHFPGKTRKNDCYCFLVYEVFRKLHGISKKLRFFRRNWNKHGCYCNYGQWNFRFMSINVTKNILND